MASDIRVDGLVGPETMCRAPLFQSLYVTGTHPGGQYHAYAVSSDGQRFLIPQFETVQAVANIPAAVAAANAAIATVRRRRVAADRNAGTASAFGQSAAPITVVLDWTAAMK